MKRILTSCLFLFLPALLYSQCCSTLTIVNEDGIPFYLFLDGKKLNDTALSTIRITDQTAALHDLRIWFVDASLPPLIKPKFSLADTLGKPIKVSYAIRRGPEGSLILRWIYQESSMLRNRDGGCADLPLQNSAFKLLMRPVYASHDENERIRICKRIIMNNCMPVAQIAKMSSVLKEEKNRLELVLLAYDFTHDIYNFTSLLKYFHQPQSLIELKKLNHN